MGIKQTDRMVRNIPDSVHDRILILKTVMKADNVAAVIGMGIANLEGGSGCTSCGAWLGRNPESPPPVTSKSWDEIAERHAQKCRWIKTKGFQIK